MKTTTTFIWWATCWSAGFVLAVPVNQNNSMTLERVPAAIPGLTPDTSTSSSSPSLPSEPSATTMVQFHDGSDAVGIPVLPSRNGSVPTQLNASRETGGQEYIVLFDPNHPQVPEVTTILGKVGWSVDHPDLNHIFDNSAFRGFSGLMKEKRISALNGLSAVALVEPVIKIKGQVSRSHDGSPWSLQRMSQQPKIAGDISRLDFTYRFDDHGQLGKGVDIYVLDTGLNTAHAAFGGRARMGFSIDGEDDLNAGSDQDGHGTHAAGTAAGDVVGVARGANIIGVKVLDSQRQGTTSDAIKGLDWVVQRHEVRKGRPGFVGSIASISWSAATISAHLDLAVDAAVTRGVHVSIAAGNNAVDACTISPASQGGRGADGTGGKAVVVGSTNELDVISDFSNRGPCVDLYAPGENIISSWVGGPDVLKTQDGTSMSCPLVSGLMAYMMAQKPGLADSPSLMKAAMTTACLLAPIPDGSNVQGHKGWFHLVNNQVPGQFQASFLAFNKTRALFNGTATIIGPSPTKLPL